MNTHKIKRMKKRHGLKTEANVKNEKFGIELIRCTYVTERHNRTNDKLSDTLYNCDVICETCLMEEQTLS